TRRRPASDRNRLAPSPVRSVAISRPRARAGGRADAGLPVAVEHRAVGAGGANGVGTAIAQWRGSARVLPCKTSRTRPTRSASPPPLVPTAEGPHGAHRGPA